MVLAYAYLAAAIVCEVIATNLLKTTEGFSRLWPSVGTALGYAAAFYLLSLALRHMTLGVAYAIWAGVGIVLTALAAWIFFHEKQDAAALLGIGLIVAGVTVINVFSKTVSH